MDTPNQSAADQHNYLIFLNIVWKEDQFSQEEMW